MLKFSAMFLALFPLARQYKESVVFVDGKRVDDPVMKEKVVSELMTNPTLHSLHSLIHPASHLGEETPSVPSEALSDTLEQVPQQVGFRGSFITIGGADDTNTDETPLEAQTEVQRNGQPVGILHAIASHLPPLRFGIRIRGRIFCRKNQPSSEEEISPSWIPSSVARLLSNHFGPCEEEVELPNQPELKEESVGEVSKQLTQPQGESLEGEAGQEADQLFYSALEALNSELERGEGSQPELSFGFSNIHAVRPLAMYDDLSESEEANQPFRDVHTHGEGSELGKQKSVSEVDCSRRRGCDECTRDLQCFYCAEGGKCLSSSSFFNKIVAASTCPASQIYYFSTCKIKSFTVLFFITIGLLSIFSVILSIAFIAVWRRYRRNKVYQFIREKEDEFSPEVDNQILE